MQRSRLGIGLQWVALAGIILQPLPMARSYWTDSDGNGTKDWVADPPVGDSWFADNSDGDGMTNEEEVLFGSDPYRLDSDLDGLTDKDERDLTLAMNGYLTTTDPWAWDSDSDGFSDHDEYYAWLQGSSPMVNYNNLPSGPSWSGGAFFTYFDADGDGIHNQDDMEPVTMDRDNDGIPNWQDSYMDDHWNGAGDPNAGGSGGSGSGGTDPGVIIGGTWYPSGTLDGDNDGIPDHMDPYPSGSYFYNGSEYGGVWSDRDWDGIPDGPDPFPDGSYSYNGVEYGGVWVDQDNDGVPDPADPWPSVLGSFWYEGMEYPGAWQDADGDGIPDFMDSWPNSRWNGEPSYFYNGIEYGGAWVDRDADGVPDPADNWQDDPENGIDSDGDGLDNYTERTLHLTDPYQVDSDNDFLTDYEELYVFHTLPLLAISHPERGQTLLDGYLHMGVDSDGDELPDLIEDHYASLGFGLDKTNPADAAGDLDGDGITNLRAYHYGWDLVAQLDQYDADRDGITDAREDAWAAMAMGTVLEGRFNKALFADAVEDPDGDGLFNFEESARDWDPTDAHSYCSGATDGQIGAWMRDVYRPGFDHGTDAMGNPIHADGVGSLYRVEEDADQDNLPDGYEYRVLNAQGGTPPPATLDHPTDQDGDGMDDLWEYRHQLDLRDILDSGSWVAGLVIHPPSSGGVADAAAAEAALIDPDFDGLSNWREYQFGTNPRIQDTDGDGVGDALELLHNTAPTSRSSLPPLVLTVLGATSLNVATGQPLSAPLTVRATRAGVPMPQVPVVFTLLSGGGTLGGQGGAYTTHTNSSGVAAATFVTPVTPGTSAITAQTQSAPPTSWSVTSTQNPGPTPDPTPDPAPTPTPQPNFPASAQVPAILENQWMISSFEDALEWNNLEEWTWSQSGSPLGWNWVKTWSGQSPGERSQIGIWLSNGGEGGGNGSAAEASIRVIPVSIAQGLQWEPTPFPLQATGSWTTSLTSTGGLGLPPNDPGTNSGDTVLRAHHARIGETYGGIIRKIRLRRHPGHDPRLTFSRSFIKVVEITGQPTTYEAVTLRIQPGQATSKPVILNGMASAHGQTRSERLLPIELTGHSRGTFNAPGAVSAGGTYGKETVLLENADRDEGSATQRDLDTATLDKANDDDLVKVVLSFPANTKPAGIGLKLKHEGMKVDGTKTTFDSAVVREGASRLNFYDDQGNKLTDADLKIDDLANPGSGYMAKIVTAGTLTLFIEGADNFGMVGTDVKSQNSAKYMGGALLTLEMTGAGAAANSGPRLLVFRGGFMHCRHPDGQPGELGTLEFRDGKGRVTNDDTDLGTVIKTWSARSGKPGGAAYNVEDGNGHIPPGWRLIYERDDFTGTQPNQQEGTGNSLVVKQGSYCRWTQDDNAPGYTTTYIYRANDENDSQIGKPAMPNGPSPDGQTIMFKFQTEVIPPTSAANRSQIQFHPDGEKDGSAGCISIQSYDDCKEVYRYLHDYNALKVKVDLE